MAIGAAGRSLSLLDRYLLLALLRGGSPVFLLLLGLFGFVALAEQLEDVGKGAFGTLEALRTVGFLLPRIALDLLPITCLLGTVIGLGQLASQLEVTALRASGISLVRLARPLLLMLLAVTGSALILQQAVIPGFEGRASDLRTRSFDNAAKEDDAYWTRSESSLVRVGEVAYGTMPSDIEIYRLDAAGRVSELIQATRADVIGPDTWLLHEALVTRFEAESVEQSHFDQLPWASDIDAEQIAALLRAEHALSPTDLVGYIGHLRSNGLDAHRFEVLLWQLLGLPMGLFAMGLLGLPFVVGNVRSTPLGARVTFCALIGILFYLLERTSLQVGLLYRFPAPLAGLAPDLLALAAALLSIRLKR